MHRLHVYPRKVLIAKESHLCHSCCFETALQLALSPSAVDPVMLQEESEHSGKLLSDIDSTTEQSL